VCPHFATEGMNQMHTIRWVQWLSWVFAIQERKKKHKCLVSKSLNKKNRHRGEWKNLTNCNLPVSTFEKLEGLQVRFRIKPEGARQVPYRNELSTMRWLRLVGSIKLLVSFAEYILFYRALLSKRPIILRSLLIIATPYDNHLSV